MRAWVPTSSAQIRRPRPMFPPKSRSSGTAGLPARAPERAQGGVALQGINGRSMRGAVVAPGASRLMGSLGYRNPPASCSCCSYLLANARPPGICRPWRPWRPWRPDLLGIAGPATSVRAFLKISLALGPKALRGTGARRVAADGNRTSVSGSPVPAASLASLASSPLRTRCWMFHVEYQKPVTLRIVVGPGPDAQEPVKLAAPRAQQTMGGRFYPVPERDRC